jgi:site-specific DNA recombinase
MAKFPFGYTINEDGNINVNEREADVVKLIFQSYIAGCSLGEISDILLEKQILSPSGNDTWARAAVDKILSNSKYIPHIINVEQFFEV